MSCWFTVTQHLSTAQPDVSVHHSSLGQLFDICNAEMSLGSLSEPEIKSNIITVEPGAVNE